MSFETNFRGGRTDVGYTPFNDSDNTYVYDSVTYPTGNLNLAGTRPVNIDYIVPTGASGVTSSEITSGGQVRLYCGTPRLTFKRNPASGGVITKAADGFTWDGGLVGYFGWSTVPSQPVSITPTRTNKDVSVAVGSATSDGGSSITSHRVQRSWSADGSTGWSAWEDEKTVSGGVALYSGLTPGRYYKFRAYANNARGSSQARESSVVFIPAGGKRRDAGTFNPTTIAKRRSAGAWVDITIAKRKSGGSMVDLS